MGRNGCLRVRTGNVERKAPAYGLYAHSLESTGKRSCGSRDGKGEPETPDKATTLPSKYFGLI